jgi:hypothetical protein
MSNGNWLMAGMDGYGRAAVMTSQGDRIDEPWHLTAIPQSLQGFAETNVLRQGDVLMAFIRPIPSQPNRVHVAESFDNGRTWGEVKATDLPAADAKIAAGTLSNGQHYLIFNYHGPRKVGTDTRHRDYPVIAVTAPGQTAFVALWRLRPDLPPEALYADHSTHHSPQWAYPYAVEHNDKLYVIYHSSKENAVLTIIPVSLLGQITSMPRQCVQVGVPLV